MNRKRFFTSLCAVLLLLSLMPTAQAAGMTASVVTGPVTFNGQKIDNSTAQYPLLLYNDITYVPMTYDLCRFMGLTTDWDDSAHTLSIDKSRDKGPYVPDTGHGVKKGSVSVTKVVNPVVVGGVSIDNALEMDYPLFLYNGVTYFPLTDNYMVSAFGWIYSWDMDSGLAVSSAARPALPCEKVNTDRPDLDAALEALNVLHRQSHVYAGTLTDRRDGSAQEFTARITVVTASFGSNVELRAEPFVFFTNGALVSAQYHTENGLAGEPRFMTGGYVPDNTPGTLHAPPYNSGTELGHLARCFLDCQFSGGRTSKILSADQENNTWHLTVAFEEDEFTQYDAVITLEDSAVTAIEISTENYTMHMALKA